MNFSNAAESRRRCLKRNTMKTLSKLLLALLLATCAACTSPAPIPPTPPEPPEPPVPVAVGHFTILEYDTPGQVARIYSGVTSFKEQDFPRAVTFDYNGRLITLTGSYQINETK